MLSHSSTRQAAFAVAITGVATLVTAMLLVVIPGAAPSPATTGHPAGFTNTILWFELAKDADEVFANLGPSDDPTGQERREVLDGINRWDFGFMVAYSTFHGALFVLIWTLNRGRRFWSGRWYVIEGLFFAGVMLVGDVFENIQLLRLTGYADASDVTAGVVHQLNVWTRVKWGAIFAASALLAVGYAVYFLRPSAKPFSRAGLITAILFLAAAGLGFPSLAVESLRHWVEHASICLLPAWVLALGHGARIALRPG